MPRPRPAWRYDDAGHALSRFAAHPGNCVCRAITIAAEIPYEDTYQRLLALAARERPRRGRPRSHPRTGVYRRTYERLLFALGFRWGPTMQIGSGTTVHLHPDELPPGRLVVTLSRHLCAVVDGTVHDTHDCTRDGTRCVYGFYRLPTEIDAP